MGTGYTRNDTTNQIADGEVIDAADLDGEFDAIVAAFSESTGHTHDGTGAEGGAIGVVGPAQDYIAGAAALYPKATSTYALGTAGATYSNIYVDNLTVAGTAIVATPAEINNLSGVTSTAAELNILEGVTCTAADLNILDGVTATTAELNILDGVTSTAAELNILDGVTSTTAELNILDGVTATTAELNLLDGVTATTAELNILDGVTSTADDLNLLDGVTATTAELNLLDGVTATTAELNILDGVTSTTAELNILDGVTATTVEINHLVGQDQGVATTDSPTFVEVTINDDVILNSDLAKITFGADSEVQLEHSADEGLKVKNTKTTAATPVRVTLESNEATLTANDEIASIDFDSNATAGGDAAGTKASIGVYATNTYSATDAGSRMEFYTSTDAGAMVKSLTLGQDQSADFTGNMTVGGGIDDTVIGGTTPASISGTTGSFTGDVSAGDVYITGPSPLLTLTDTDGADEYTQLLNSGGSTFLRSRDGASDGPIMFQGFGGGVVAEYGRFTGSGNFGIGTTSPSAALDVVGDAEINGTVTVTGTEAKLIWQSSDVNHTNAFARDSDGNFGFYDVENGRTWFRHVKNASVSSQELSLLEGGGNVGINTSSPSATLDVVGDAEINGQLEVVGSGQSLTFTGTNTTNTGGSIYKTSTGVTAAIIDVSGASGDIQIKSDPDNALTNSNIVMQVDGATTLSVEPNFLDVTGDVTINQVGTTTTGERRLAVRSIGYAVLELSGDRSNTSGEPGGAGMTVGVDGTGPNGVVSYINTAGEDGVGGSYTGASDNSMLVGTISNHLLTFGYGSTVKLALTATQLRPVADNNLTLGGPSFRWSTVYAASGSINTSDATTKQDIDVISEAETRVALACKGLMRKFRFIDAVDKKGDDARIHFGIIAQDLQAAFVAEGLDPNRYAMFCSDTWWEEDIVIPARDAVDAVLDDEGNVVKEGREAVPETTQLKVYETAEEATETATEVTRLGIRYSDLLAFIITAM